MSEALGFPQDRFDRPSSILTRAAQAGPFCFDITANEVLFHDDDNDDVFVPVFLAVEEITREVYVQAEFVTPQNAGMFLGQLVNQFPQKINAVTTEPLPVFTDCRVMHGVDMAAFGRIRWRSPAAPMESPTPTSKSFEAKDRKPLKPKGRSLT